VIITDIVSTTTGAAGGAMVRSVAARFCVEARLTEAAQAKP